jgi:hypothetical protein
MPDNPPLSTASFQAIYEDIIPLKGGKFSLKDVASLFSDFRDLTIKEGEVIVGGLVREKGKSVKDFEDYKKRVKIDAFRVTVSINGFDGQTRFGDSKDLFSRDDLPKPIKSIYFTNINSFKREANGSEPRNRFECWIHFEKPPLFDPNPLVSEPTSNASRILVQAEDSAYFKAAQKIANDFDNNTKHWYRAIHKGFSYDVGLWFLWVPFSLFKISQWIEGLPYTPAETSIFKIALGFYLFVLCLMLYRAFVGYVKWAFPVNVLIENNDAAVRHRVILGALVATILYSVPTSWIMKTLGID